MSQGLAALHESLTSPQQNLRMLASWLHFAAGITGKAEYNGRVHHLRSCPSAGALYPCEVYVLALAIEGLQPALYHFSPRDFCLYRLRDGQEALSQLKRGRPDLELLKTMPAIALVSTIPWRTAWRYGHRGYRYATIDAGHLIENLVQVGTGLGMQTLVRMHLNDRNTRELIGVPKDCPFDEYETVQGFVAWANKAATPISTVRRPPTALPPIPRPRLSSEYTDYPAIRAAHDDCIAPGVGVVELRPPYSESSAVSPKAQQWPIEPPNIATDKSLLKTLTARRSVRQFQPHGITRDQFAMLNQLAFRGGTYHPIRPEGPHLGLIRPLWFVHGVQNITPGVYYYSPQTDRYVTIRYSEARFDSRYLFGDQEMCGQASAVCVMIADLTAAMRNSSPDAYREAHLEAGIAGQRLYLACTAMGIDCCAAGSFLDDELRRAFDIADTDWECLYGFAVGSQREPIA
jgi:SagB-type dehydrogenase family enzyme